MTITDNIRPPAWRYGRVTMAPSPNPLPTSPKCHRSAIKEQSRKHQPQLLPAGMGRTRVEARGHWPTTRVPSVLTHRYTGSGSRPCLRPLVALEKDSENTGELFQRQPSRLQTPPQHTVAPLWSKSAGASKHVCDSCNSLLLVCLLATHCILTWASSYTQRSSKVLTKKSVFYEWSPEWERAARVDSILKI